MREIEVRDKALDPSLALITIDSCLDESGGSIYLSIKVGHYSRFLKCVWFFYFVFIYLFRYVIDIIDFILFYLFLIS